jgi:hypothetical protein
VQHERKVPNFVCATLKRSVSTYLQFLTCAQPRCINCLLLNFFALFDYRALKIVEFFVEKITFIVPE